MAYLNCNNARGNANANYGARSRSQSHAKVQRVTHGWRHWNGRGTFPTGKPFRAHYARVRDTWYIIIGCNAETL